MTLATTGLEGLWAAAVFYVNDRFSLYFLSAPTSRHSINIASHPRVAATIQEDYEDWPKIQGIQLEGQVERISAVEQASAVMRYGLKFPIIANLSRAPEEIVRAMDDIAWYKLIPDKFYFIDNSLGLGHRDEIPLG